MQGNNPQDKDKEIDDKDQDEAGYKKTKKGLRFTSYAYGSLSVSLFLILVAGSLILLGESTGQEIQMKINFICTGTIVIFPTILLFVVGVGNISTSSKMFPDRYQKRVDYAILFFFVGLVSYLVAILSPFLFLYPIYSSDPSIFIFRSTLLFVQVLSLLGTFFLSLMALYLILNKYRDSIFLKTGFWINITLTLGTFVLFLILLYIAPEDRMVQIRNLHYLTIGVSLPGHMLFFKAYRSIYHKLSKEEISALIQEE